MTNYDKKIKELEESNNELQWIVDDLKNKLRDYEIKLRDSLEKVNILQNTNE